MMKNSELNVINIDDYRKKEELNKRNYESETITKILSDSFYEDLRKEKRKEKGLWDYGIKTNIRFGKGSI